MGSLASELGKTLTAEQVGTPPKQPKNFKRSTTRALRQLCDMYSQVEVAEMVGVSSSGLNTMLGKDDTSFAVEKLAEMIIHNEGKVVRVERRRLFICRVDNEQVGTVRTVLEALGVQMKEFAE